MLSIQIKKLNLLQVIKIITVIVVIIVIGMVGLLCTFLYKNFYQTINHLRTILVLRSEIALTTPDTATYNQILERVEQEDGEEIRWEEIKDPFAQYE